MRAAIALASEPGGAALSFLWIALLLVAAKLSSLVERFGQPGVLGELVAEAEERIAAPAPPGYVDRLEKAGLVERVRDESDRRRGGLTLTEEGDRLLKRVRARRTTWLAERMRGLDDDELETLERAIEPLGKLL